MEEMIGSLLRGGHVMFAFILMLSVLIFVHEFGHFIVAKWCGVTVLKFSIGFGGPIGFGKWRLRWESGGTEYVIAWFPLGGYVKMVGENPDEEESPEALSDPEGSLNNKPVFQKLAIVFAGPVVNLIVPIFIYMGIFAVGMPHAAAVIGSIELASPAAQAGLVEGDRVLEIDGSPTSWWADVSDIYRDRGNEKLTFKVERAGETLEIPVAVEERSRLDEFGGKVSAGWLGISHHRQKPILGVPETKTPAAIAGLLSGDLIKTLDGAEVEDWGEFVKQYAAATGSEVKLSVERLVGEEKEEVALAVPALGDPSALGVIPASVLLHSVDPEMPAGEAGLEAGDLIVAMDGKPVGSFDSFAEKVRLSGGEALAITFARGGETKTVSMKPKLAEANNEIGFPEERYLVGVTSNVSMLAGTYEEEVIWNPIASFVRSIEETASSMAFFMRSLSKLASGEVSHKQLAGPIGIAEIADKALQAGWIPYLQMMILISINLGILNLLPIPVLDGGQAVIFTAEGLKGSPISIRTKEALQTGGFMALLLLMGLAFWNDIARNWARFME